MQTVDCSTLNPTLSLRRRQMLAAKARVPYRLRLGADEPRLRYRESLRPLTSLTTSTHHLYPGLIIPYSQTTVILIQPDETDTRTQIRKGKETAAKTFYCNKIPS